MDGAIRAMRAAADLEDSVDKHPVTPSSPLPTRELLGEMLLDAGRPDEALTAFQASLAVSPGRLNSLSGAGRAAELAGDDQAAADYYRQAAQLVEPPVDRPRMGEARAFLETGDTG
ncbi:MAG: tetratricopeptide repeat protein [Gemmatimonadetes bacterium]|nr:tetratricopeptide repeat protein [Gemmatimonadota bacterium]NIQ52427.1 tetratricopeptide repeat protein [Gemmatimonadota bacterium]NIU72558.1 tetratricopeptide repeat protein [Gammaproteobacteria bacterium]NIX42977.1 tetratricopeptide repeat protein [Gemmatimonadota bacterium]NIY07157.1 tetratricopeptide repeat protein [Gemmatimonadota bacterium]